VQWCRGDAQEQNMYRGGAEELVDHGAEMVQKRDGPEVVVRRGGGAGAGAQVVKMWCRGADAGAEVVHRCCR